MTKNRLQLISKHRLNPLLTVGLILIAALLLSSLYLSVSSQRLARMETLRLGENLAAQTDIMSRPLLLANDRISLNYLANQLIELDYISGLEMKNSDRIVVVRAGAASDLKLTSELGSNQALGSLTLWLNSQPTSALIRQPLMYAAIFAVSSLVLALLMLWYSLRDQQINAPQPPRRTSFAKVLEQQSTEVIDTSDTDTPEPDAEPPLEAGPDETPSQHSEEEETRSLVELLKPERNSVQHMPRFEHHPQDLPDFAAPQDNTEDELVLEERGVGGKSAVKKTAQAPTRENPLLKNLTERQEVQLDLYPFEHELELMLAAENACYLLYIDTVTPASDNTEPELRQQLLKVYQQLARQVAGIYQGETEQKASGDMVIRFQDSREDDNHGINALCAAMLFNLIYRLYNQSRIREFKPVLNLQIALARGHREKSDLLLEEARFLTRTIQSNALISHTALTEAPKLKQSLLQDAEIRREDEDKVIVQKLGPKHQELLQKQAKHLLTKFFSLLKQETTAT